MIAQLEELEISSYSTPSSDALIPLLPSISSTSHSFDFLQRASFLLLSDSKDDVYPYISWTGNYDVVENEKFWRQDEVEDDRVKLLKRMIMNKFDFSGHIWEHEEKPVFSFGLDNEEGETEDVATHEGDSVPDDEVSNDNVGEGGSDEAGGSNEASESDEEFQTPKGSATIGTRDTKGKKRLPDRGMEKRKHKVLQTRPQQAPFGEDMKTFVTQLFQQNFAAMEERLEKKMGERFEELQSQLKSSRGDSTVEVEHGDPPASKPPVSNTSPSNLAPSKPSASNPSRSHLAPSNPSASNALPSKPSPRRSKRLTNNDKVASDWWTPMTTVRKLPKARSPQATPAPTSARWDRWTRGPSKKLQLVTQQWKMTVLHRPLYYLTEEAWQRFTEWSTNPTALRIGDVRPGNHWVAVCVNIIEKKVEVYDCSRGRNRQYVEKFAAMIPRIVKAVGPPKSKLHLSSYSTDMPMQMRLNKSCVDYGHTLKHLECILLGVDLSLVEDGIMPGCRQNIAYDIWEAAYDPIIIQLMAQHMPSDLESSDVYDLEED
ncbi:hypothetical protein Bca52824_036950 [Brassica carinata]|uniref:Ubiquitin-like protease family profile domain-containing protein n=1 Tax=Brassica carinata TaxID=52824 RepID=A0A8X7S695_BRACI|nr:hypothetical protein Bca52824_036950 [Brassica carinata]